MTSWLRRESKQLQFAHHFDAAIPRGFQTIEQASLAWQNKSVAFQGKTFVMINILCLHGFQQNADMLYRNMGVLRKSLKSTTNFSGPLQ